MRKLIVAFILLSTLVTAQVPKKMSFQTVVRNSLGKLFANKSIGVRLSILQNSSTGTAVYVETHSKTTNINGLLTLEVGTGTVTSGNFSSINWSQGPYFLKTEMDVNGGTSYTITGVTEFVSVPYALNAAVADSIKMLNKGENIGDMCYWNGTTWVPLNKGAQGQFLIFCDGKPTWANNGVCPDPIATLDCPSASHNGTVIAYTAVSGVSIEISYTGGNGAVHNGQVVVSTGVTGLTATLQPGTFANGSGNLTYTITGTPSAGGTANFALNIGGKTCSINRSIVLPLGALGNLECATATNNGTLTATTAASGVTCVISYTGGNGGTHNGQVVTSTGVTGLTATLQSGTFANGNGSLTYTITGTPSASGTASFALNIGGKSCVIYRSVILPVGALGMLDCANATNNGTLNATTTATGVTCVISYTGGNGGTHNGQVVTSTGVNGLTATLQSGTFANGNGSLTYTITGTPSASGTASFTLNIGGKSCVIYRSVILPVGALGTLDCANATNNGTLNATTTATGVSCVISYTSGNGGTHNGQVITSTGVNGLTATLQSGTFANGNGSLTYTITGTPSASGTASFTLNIGGKSCILTRNVLLPIGTISTLECATTTNNGALTATTVASGVTSVIPYTGGNGGTNNGQVVTSTVVTGLTATLSAGTFAIGNGSLTYTISGNPSTNGTANFAINIGGKTCILYRSVMLQPGTISTIDCPSATHNGILTKNELASGVTSVISYTGGNGGIYNGQIVASTGITGLTVNLTSGGVFANGNGTLTYVIKGTPSISGIAYFAINIGGKTCELRRYVNGYNQNITDIDGNTYKTVQIGTQQWMAENLNTSKYNDGSSLPNVSDDTEWDVNTTGAWCYYDNDSISNNKYGKLYNWYALNIATNGNRNICPIGWHIPSYDEWNVLEDYLGGGMTAGGKMKETGTNNWVSPNTDATNQSLFTGLPVGFRSYIGSYYWYGSMGYWWSSTELETADAWSIVLYNSTSSVDNYTNVKAAGLSVRCLKD